MRASALTVEDRFWEKVFKSSNPDACWEWTHGTTQGYGRLFICRVDGYAIYEYAHRFAYELLVDTIPFGMEIDHTCKNRRCCNPAHLEVVTGAENKRREGARQTHCVHGHRYTIQNTYIDPSGGRRCRRCARERSLAA